MDGQFEEFVKKLGEYVMRVFFLPWMKEHGVVQSYRAQVVSVDSGNRRMTVQRPFDSPVSLPYTDAAASLQAGDQCLVFVLGESSNAIVVADGAGEKL